MEKIIESLLSLLFLSLPSLLYLISSPCLSLPCLSSIFFLFRCFAFPYIFFYVSPTSKFSLSIFLYLSMSSLSISLLHLS